MEEQKLKPEHDHFLGTPEGFAEYLSEVFKSRDSTQVTEATAAAVCWHGISDIARAAHLTRVSTYRDYAAGGEPSLKSFLAVLDALGVELQAIPKSQ